MSRGSCACGIISAILLRPLPYLRKWAVALGRVGIFP